MEEDLKAIAERRKVANDREKQELELGQRKLPQRKACRVGRTTIRQKTT